MPPLSPLLDAPDTKTVLRQVQRSGSSFLLGMMALPAPRRRAMFGLYAFCRVVDDIADHADSNWNASQRLAALQVWRTHVAALFNGKATHPIMELLQQPITEYQLAQADFLAIITGMEMDGNTPLHAPSQAVLDHYCDCVASAVGRIAVRIFGETSAEGIKVAHHLGRALQLTNILRDVDEDARIGRLYLPAESLQEAGIASEQAIPAILSHPQLDTACRKVAQAAKDHFAAAATAIQHCNRQAMKPARLMEAYYHRILLKLLQTGWHSPRPRIRLGGITKIGLLLRALLP